MPRKPRFRQNTWHFSDAGNKFDGRPKPARSNKLAPISPALKRGIIHCKRCGSRVVGNVSNCPFCGKSLRPVYARFWFWLIVVVVVAVSVVGFINVSLPEESTAPTSPATPELPRVVGGTEDSVPKNLALGTAIDNSGLEVTVGSVTAGPVAANGSHIYVVEVEFINQTQGTVTLYSTQWLLETSEGTRLDTFVGATADGVTLSTNFEAGYPLPAQGRFSGRLYFAITQQPPATEEELAAGSEPTPPVIPSLVVYQPSALAYSEELLVTWKVPSSVL